MRLALAVEFLPIFILVKQFYNILIVLVLTIFSTQNLVANEVFILTENSCGSVKDISNAGGDLLSAFKSKLSSRVNSASGFVLKHTNEQISAIIQKGKALGLSDDVIDDLLFISCRDAKLIDADGLMKQMDNWVNVVQKRGYPYKFADIVEFNRFKSDLKNRLNSIGISNSDVRIQGSSLRSPDASDVDLVAMVS
ncbi:hypothetical protein GCM10022393_42490 [Aquimarina addita]|uniref:Uncharacterized protein n=1 Tax=Aquimarina addita TaxID=870485 RepID=A0ABP6UWU0_9FLAO